MFPGGTSPSVVGGVVCRFTTPFVHQGNPQMNYPGWNDL